MDKLKRTVIKEELVELTGNYVDAVILNQFIYWSERVNDFDKYQQEEKELADKYNGDFAPNYFNGWIYKSAEQLSEETMLGLSASSMRKHIQNLINKGFLAERNNPKYKWDKTKQYRVQINFIQESLNVLGYSLDGYKRRCTQDGNLMHCKEENNDNRISKIENGCESFRKAIPENTTEITTEIKNNIHAFPENTHARETINEEIQDFIEDYFILYEQYFGRTHPPLTAKQMNNIVQRLEDFLDEINCSEETLLKIARIYLKNPGNTDGNIKCFAINENLRIYLSRFYALDSKYTTNEW